MSDTTAARAGAARAGVARPPAPGPPAAAAPRPVGRPGGRRGGRLRTATELTILLGPALALFVGFVLVPIVIAIYYSLFNWDGLGPLTDFTGARNYLVAFKDPAFIGAIEHTLLLTGLSVVIQLPLSVAISLLLNRKFRGRGFMRLVTFAPYVLPPAVTAVMWQLILQPGGFMDQLFSAVGLGGAVQLWLADTHVVIWTVFLVLTWQYIGFGIVLLLAGLQGIPRELHEAAAIDGATAWQATRMVTLPLLGPTIRVWVFINVIGALQIFDINQILTNGGPGGASSTIATYMYQDGFRSLEFGYGAAIAVILFVFCFVFAVAWQRYAMRRDTAGALTRAVS
jgi:raffinose/stachyose/melibiose transport system permease protein